MVTLGTSEKSSQNVKIGLFGHV